MDNETPEDRIARLERELAEARAQKKRRNSNAFAGDKREWAWYHYHWYNRQERREIFWHLQLDGANPVSRAGFGVMMWFYQRWTNFLMAVRG